MKRLLITGAGGFLGWNLCGIAGNGWDVFGITHRNPSPIEAVKVLKADLTRSREIKELMREIRPHGVIHTAAASQVNYCQQNPDESYKINVTATVDLARFCADLSIPFVFTSTDMVFDGLNAPYREEDPVCPLNVYGVHKAEAERAVLENYPSAAVCRLSLVFGDAGPGASSLVHSWIEALRNGVELKLFTDEYRTMISAQDASRGLLIALDKTSGTLHLGGPERFSRFQFGEILRDLLGAKAAKLTPCLQKDLPMPAPRPPDVSLDITKAFELGFRPGTVREELRILRAVRSFVSRNETSQGGMGV